MIKLTFNAHFLPPVFIPVHEYFLSAVDSEYNCKLNYQIHSGFICIILNVL